MWLARKQELCVVLMLITMGQALLIVGPTTLLANRDYTVVVSNFFGEVTEADLLLRLEGHDDGGQTLLSFNKSIVVHANTNEIISFQIPPIAIAGNYKMNIEGMNSFVYHEEVELEYIPKSTSGLIQLSKPAYKPGDSVQFRVIVLEPDLKPPSDTKSVNVIVQDPVGNNIRKWSNVLLYNGVFEGQLDIAPSPLLGTYNIEVEANGEHLVSKPFQVDEYVLFSFEVNVYPTVIPLEEHQALNLTVEANDYLRKPVIGNVKLQVYDENRVLSYPIERNVNGILQIHLPFRNKLELFEDHQDVILTITFTEQRTKRTISQQHRVAVYKEKYQVRLLGAAVFNSVTSNGIKLAIEDRDGKPAKQLALNISIAFMNTLLSDTYTSDNDGIITLETVGPFSCADELVITVSYSNRVLLKKSFKKPNPISLSLNIKTETRKLYPEKPFRVEVTSTHNMTLLLCYIVSKGRIIFSQSVQVDNQSYLFIELPRNAMINMTSRSVIVVATIIENAFVYDIATVDGEHSANNIEFKLMEDQHELRPDNTINIAITGRPNAYVALASYDRRLLQQGKDDISSFEWKKFMQLFNENNDDEASSSFEDIGLFIRANDLRIEEVVDKSSRTGMLPNHDRSDQLYPIFRTDFLDSWLWESITLPTNGSSTLTAAIPDSTTTWYLAGFSIDPVYGFEVIKTPLQFSTSLPFYIVDNLPYSIKRGEVVALHFILFNTLGAEYITDVTMFNVKDEVELIGQSANAKHHTKTVSVPPNVGYPISFLVKAKKLGDITVRVKASIVPNLATDAIEKIIRVTPESLVIADVKSHFFSFNEPKSQTYEMVLDIEDKLDFNSLKINFSLTPIIVTDIVSNLDNLLAVPLGSGEGSMNRFVPNIVVLDYMMAIGSKQTDVINKAKEYMRKGYQNQMKFQQKDGSYGVWRSSGGSVFLTAFVAKSLQTAAKYIYVDENKVSRAYDWLASKQQTSGRYVEVGLIMHPDMQGGLRQGLALTSYVMIAFLENPQQATRHRTVVERGMKHIADNVEWMTDVYDVAIATYALWLNNHNKKSRALDKLMGLSVVAENGSRYWPRSAHNIETTAYGLLSLLEAGRNTDGIQIFGWLVKQRYIVGSLSRTQDTFVGLKALTKLSQKINLSMNEYDMQLTIENTTKEYRVDSNSIRKFQLDDLPQTTRKLSVNIAGQGSGFIQLAYSYLLNLVYFERSFKLAVSKIDTDSTAVLKLEVCTSFIPKYSDHRSNLVLVEVTLPSGYVTRTDLIDEKVHFNKILRTEILYGATTAVLYYDSMGQEKNCFTITAHKWMKEVIRRPSYVKVHDYYHPDWNAIQIYEIDKQEVCDVCAKGNCPPSCSFYI